MFFRASAREMAVSLALTGVATNLADGRVEVIACGTPDALDRLCAWLHRGPTYARVSTVVCDVVPIREFDGFTIR